MKTIKVALFFFFCSVTLATLHGQVYDKMKGGGHPDPQLSQEDNDYLDRQAQVFLDTVSAILLAHPASTKPDASRNTAKLLMDAVFHEHFAVYRKPTQQFFRSRVDQVIRELEQTRVSHGVVVWKVYNMGFIARTASVTLAFDLVTGITSGSADFAMSPDQVSRLTRQCDALLVTHKHPDHADLTIAREFIRGGLPVVTPEGIWQDDSIYAKIVHLPRMVDTLQSLPLKKCTLGLVVYPGHQLRSIINNVYLVQTPEKITLAHIGDQINEGDFMPDFTWIDRVGKKYPVDILMPNAWTTDIFRIARGFNPKLVLPGHELELGHTVWDRLPYWGDDRYLGLNYGELKKSTYPVVVMFWGESVRYIPGQKTPGDYFPR